MAERIDRMVGYYLREASTGSHENLFRFRVPGCANDTHSWSCCDRCIEPHILIWAVYVIEP